MIKKLEKIAAVCGSIMAIVGMIAYAWSFVPEPEIDILEVDYNSFTAIIDVELDKCMRIEAQLTGFAPREKLQFFDLNNVPIKETDEQYDKRMIKTHNNTCGRKIGLLADDLKTSVEDAHNNYYNGLVDDVMYKKIIKHNMRKDYYMERQTIMEQQKYYPQCADDVEPLVPDSYKEVTAEFCIDYVRLITKLERDSLIVVK